MKRCIVLLTVVLGISCLPFDESGKDSKRGKSSDGQTSTNDRSTFEKIQENNVKIGLMEDGLFGDEEDRLLGNEEVDNGAHYHKRQKRVAWHDYKWPKIGEYVYIPYRLSSSYFLTRIVFLQAVAQFNNRTCVRWIPRTTERYYVHVREASGCYAYIGKRDDRFSFSQTLSLSYPGCATVGIAIHEAMHTIGFYHTMARRDRDNFLEFNYANMLSIYQRQFREHNLHEGSIFGRSFDFNSVMMYPWNAFAIDRSRPTIIDKSNRTRTWQTSSLWSESDIEQINRLYQCNGYYTLDN